jgi:uncharacterized membrane protein
MTQWLGGMTVRLDFSGRPASRSCRAIALLALGVFLQGNVAGCSGSTAKYPELLARNEVVAVDISGISAGSGRFHSFRSGSGKLVDLFVYRESSGTPHAVLDACRTCYRWRKGYALHGSEVVCLKCDMRFRLDGLAQGTGSCVPVALKTEAHGDTLMIPVTELEAGARFF